MPTRRRVTGVGAEHPAQLRHDRIVGDRLDGRAGTAAAGLLGDDEVARAERCDLRQMGDAKDLATRRECPQVLADRLPAPGGDRVQPRPDRQGPRLGDLPAREHRPPDARLRQPAATPPSPDPALAAAFEQFDADKSADVAVFWGEGGAFCAGWDLKSVSNLEQGNPVGRLDFPKDGGATVGRY